MKQPAAYSNGLSAPFPRRTLETLEGHSRFFWAMITLDLILAIGELDLLTGYELSFSLFYLVPIGLVAWCAGRGFGIAAAVVSAGAWLFADVAAGHPYSDVRLIFWNGVIRLVFFTVLAVPLARLKELLDQELKSSRTDYLTGASSGGYFYELLNEAMERCRQRGEPFALAYADLDDFKIINDTLGHSAGDQVLRSVIGGIQKRLPEGCVVARLGGDEIAILLTGIDAGQVPLMIAGMQAGLEGDMQARGWPITWSMGAMIFETAPDSPDEAVRLADELMYQVKRGGKRDVRCALYAGQLQAGEPVPA